jgi:hypothetical protein
MNGGVPVLPIYAFMVWTGATLCFQFHIYYIEIKEDGTSGWGGGGGGRAAQGKN